MMFVNKTPNNSAQFEQLRPLIASASTQEDFGNFSSQIKRVNPTPAQLFQVVEIALLSSPTINSKIQCMDLVEDYTKQSLRRFPGGDSPNLEAVQMCHAFRDAGNMADFCRKNLNAVASISEGRDDITAEDLKADLLAKLQDTVRLILKVKQLPVEDRTAHSDPAPKELKRTREDFLRGFGTVDPKEFLDNLGL